MSEHRLPQGRAIIDSIVSLGNALGYWVEREFGVEQTDVGEPPAVDIAWFTEQHQKFPLMIFEIETSPTAAIANNPMKVFAQDTDSFEKPLFFFHLILSGGQTSSRVRNLTKQYGSFNYRVYRLGNDEGTRFVCDVLEQHRRIRDWIDYVRFYDALRSETWRDIADPITALRYTATLGFSSESRLFAYIRLAGVFDELIPELPQLIENEHDKAWPNIANLETYLGR